jgi:hypothetical protein
VASRFNPCNLPFGTAKVQSSRVRGPIVFGWSLLPKGYSGIRQLSRFAKKKLIISIRRCMIFLDIEAKKYS